MKPYYQHAGITIYHGDSREMMPSAPFSVVSDPPYGIDACNMTLGKGKKEFVRGDWDKKAPDLKHLMPARFLCIWGGNYFTDQLPPTNHWLIWHKLNDRRSFSECEMAWSNFGKQTRHLSHHWSGEEKQHPTQKPYPVMAWCLSMLPNDHGILVDPYMGSGTTLEAAKNLGLSCVGIDIEERYCEIAAKRLAQEVLF